MAPVCNNWSKHYYKMNRAMEESTILSEKELITRSLAELEFHKVLERIADFAISDLGRELIGAALPSDNLAWLTEEHQRIDELLILLFEGRVLPLEGLSDTRPLLHKTLVEHAFLQPTELLAVRDTMRTARVLRAALLERSGDLPALAAFVDPLHENRLLEKHIHEAIDDNGTVRDNASRDLARIRRDIFDTSNRLRQRLNKILSKVKEADAITDEFVTQRDGRFVLPMKTEYKRHIPGIIHGVSNTGATVFVEPAETFDLNNEISLLNNEEEREVRKILTTLSSELGQEARELLRTVDILAHFDAALAKARYAHEFGGMKPAIRDDSLIMLREVRHPLLMHAKHRGGVVPLTVEFEAPVAGHLISGPNAGGKTVALKSIGLNVAMALAGIFPLGECATGYRTIFTAIGDNQSIENDVSTFSSQLIRLREILTNCSSTALVLVDEICSGTDPQEGSALAVGILEGFLARGASFMVTTHQTSLKSYALTRQEISNASMEFDADKLEPTYRFLARVPGNSYAFVLAESLRMPPAVMARARDHVGERHNELERSIEVIQRYRRESENLRNEAAAVKAKAEQAQRDYEAKFEDFRRKYKDLIKAARAEAAAVVDNANKLVENTIREIREEKKSIADVRKEYDRERKEILRKAAQQEKQVTRREEFHEGDVVVMEGFEKPGVIVALDESGDSAVVEFDAVKFKTALDKLKRSGKKLEAKKKSSLEFRTDAQTRVDLRGMYADQATLEVENAISEALMSPIREITIVHGKGTGALRSAIQRMLKSHPAVARFRDGRLTEGGAGVTVAELK